MKEAPKTQVWVRWWVGWRTLGLRHANFCTHKLKFCLEVCKCITYLVQFVGLFYFQAFGPIRVDVVFFTCCLCAYTVHAYSRCVVFAQGSMTYKFEVPGYTIDNVYQIMYYNALQSRRLQRCIRFRYLGDVDVCSDAFLIKCLIVLDS